jgi:hypothetical protein
MNKSDIKPAPRQSVPESNIISAEIVTAKGNVKIRLTAIIMAGVIVLALLIGGLYAYFVNPAQSKDLWLIIGPIISAAVSGLVGYEIGKKSKDS